jgi:CubicO group peptidase (beta-lactamase class C family)
MKRGWLVVAAACVALAGGASSLAVGQDPRLDAALRDIDTRIAADFAKDGVGGISLGVVSGDKLVWSKHYGYAEAETKRVADNDTVYRVGSITKQFTALALLQLVEQGKMRLTDPLEKHVPEVRNVQKSFAGTPPITLLQVATMHSGLAREPGCANHSVGPNSVWQKIVVDCLPQTSYVNEPGTTYLYSNIGYASLGVAIERAGAAPFITQVHDRILKPLGMSRSGMDATPGMRANLAHGYQRRQGATPPSREAADRELDGRGYRVPNGALFSTVTDLSKFLVWELGLGPDGILKKETQDANYNRAFYYNAAMTAGYGVGFQVTRRGDVVMLGHGGSTAGYHSAALVHRPTRLGVVVLRNCDNCPADAGPIAASALESLVKSVR